MGTRARVFVVVCGAVVAASSPACTCGRPRADVARDDAPSAAREPQTDAAAPDAAERVAHLPTRTVLIGYHELDDSAQGVIAAIGDDAHVDAVVATSSATTSSLQGHFEADGTLVLGTSPNADGGNGGAPPSYRIAPEAREPDGGRRARIRIGARTVEEDDVLVGVQSSASSRIAGSVGPARVLGALSTKGSGDAGESFGGEYTYARHAESLLLEGLI